MKRFAAIAALLLIASCGGNGETTDPDYIDSGGTDFPEDWINYLDDYDEALELAKSEGLPMALYFVSDKSKACRDLNNGLLADDGVRAAASEFVFVVVDCTNPFDEEKRMEQYSVKKIPMIVFAKPDGKRVNYLKERDPEAAVHKFDAILERYAKSGDDE